MFTACQLDVCDDHVMSSVSGQGLNLAQMCSTEFPNLRLGQSTMKIFPTNVVSKEAGKVILPIIYTACQKKLITSSGRRSLKSTRFEKCLS